MEKKNPTQKEVILKHLKRGVKITGSNAYHLTKVESGRGSLNCHKLIASLRKDGHKIKDVWADKHTHKIFTLIKK